MKKLFTLLALALCAVGTAWGENAVVTWKVSGAPAGGIVSHSNSDVLQIAFGTAINSDANDWKTGSGSVDVTYKGTKYSFSTYATTGNVNGGNSSSYAADGSSSGNYIAFVPKFDGTLIVVAQNLGTNSESKPTWCYENGAVKDGTIIGNGTLDIAYDGKTDVRTLNSGTAVNGGIKISVEANKVYTFSQQGSKARWEGVIYEYSPTPSTTTTANAAKNDQTYYGTNDAAGISAKVNEITFPGIATMAGTNIQAGSIMFTIDTKTYKSFKVARGSTYVITPANGITINSATLYALANHASNTCTITTGDGDTSTGVNTDKETPTKITLTKNGEGKFYFTVSNESAHTQAIVVLVLNYDKVANVDVKVSSAGYATLYYGEKLAIPAGVTAYSASVNGDKIKLTEVADVIPANTGVILEAAEGTYNFVVTTDAAPTVTGNILTGTTTGTTVTANSVYTLGQDSEGVVGLRQYSGTSIRAYSAYTTSIDPSAAPMFMSFDFGTTTAIDEAKTSVTEKGGVRKYVKNGRLVIENAKGTFSVAGAQMK